MPDKQQYVSVLSMSYDHHYAMILYGLVFLYPIPCLSPSLFLSPAISIQLPLPLSPFPWPNLSLSILPPFKLLSTNKWHWALHVAIWFGPQVMQGIRCFVIGSKTKIAHTQNHRHRFIHTEQYGVHHFRYCVLFIRPSKS